MSALKTAAVLCEVAAEREAQDSKWMGDQNHPSFRPGMDYDAATEAEAKRWCDTRARSGSLAYADILCEEYHEVIGTNTATLTPHTNDECTRAELVQLAAVAVAMIEAIDRRAGGMS